MSKKCHASKGQTESPLKPAMEGNYWDPLNSPDWDALGKPNEAQVKKFNYHLTDLLIELDEKIFISRPDNKQTVLHILITGPPASPYDNGIFNFVLRVGPQYPEQPPRVKFLSEERVNPHFKKNGKVSASLFGTRGTSTWKASYTISDAILCLQSLLTGKREDDQKENPNAEEKEDKRNEVTIIHEVCRVTVCDEVSSILRGESILDKKIQHKIVTLFSEELYMYWSEKCMALVGADGAQKKGITYEFGDMLDRLTELVLQCQESMVPEEEAESSR